MHPSVGRRGSCPAQIPDFSLLTPFAQLFNAAAVSQDAVKTDKTSDAAAPGGNSFRISDQPMVGERRAALPRPGQSPARASSADLLYVIARDPQSLFLYWDLDWMWLFARAGISPRQVLLRTFRGDGTVESTQEINPFRGHCYVEVGAPGMEYYCELGSFEGAEWKGLARSGTTATPEARMCDDFSAEFAALPIHLSFQKLLDILGVTDLDQATLARSVAELQVNARLLQIGMASGDWSQLATEIAAELNGANGSKMNGADAAELSALVELALRSPAPAPATAEELARWKELGERYGGSSWSGASHCGFGGSSLP